MNEHWKQGFFSGDRFYVLLSRIIVWGLIFGILYLLKSFFLLVFLTFIFAYLQASGVERLEKRIPSRPLRVVLVASVFLGLLIALGIYLFPRVKAQAQIFTLQFGSYVESIDRHVLELSKEYEFLETLVHEGDGDPVTKGDHSYPTVNGHKSFTMGLLYQAAGFSDDADGQKAMKQMLDAIGDIGGKLIAIVSAFLLALLFAFLIVLDLPTLRASVQDLQNTKLGYIYHEVAGSVRDFSVQLGRALEAQFFIAIVNTLLTAIGIYVLGLGEQIAFLSLIVFICSFIPVAGVVISSVPICILALQEYGFQGVFLVVAMISIVHVIEAYILNPRIYGSHFRINPVVVLIILTVAGKLFHVWGLILGVPVCSYIFSHAIRDTSDDSQAALSL